MSLDFAEINKRALERLEPLVRELFPGGVKSGADYRIGDIAGTPGKSLSVHLTTGKWKDFATGDGGSDPISLFAAARNCGQYRAARELALLLGIPTESDIDNKTKWEVISPVPDNTSCPTFVHPRNGKPTTTWEYRDSEGRLLSYACRFDLKDGAKLVLPLVWAKRGSQRSWRWLSLPKPRPLYNLRELALSPGAKVLVVEGEKTAEAAKKILGQDSGYVVTTWQGGSAATNYVDWSPLRDREVLILPDRDKAGRTAATAIVGLLEAGKIVSPPAGPEDGWDLADGLNEGWQSDKLTHHLQDAIEVHTPPLVGPPFVDFAKILQGDMQPEKPSVAEAIEGMPLLYAGRLNEIHGEPCIGKTNISLALCIAVMSKGGSVLFIDPEDSPSGICRRLIALGATAEMVLNQFNYPESPAVDCYDELHRWAISARPKLVVLDGLAESLAAEGLNEDKPGEVLPFFKSRIRPFAETGAAVLITDHVVKSNENRGRYPRGSGAKMGRYDGAVFSGELVKSYSPTVAGSVRLVICKDRCGGLGPIGTSVLEIAFTPNEIQGRTSVTFHLPEAAAVPPPDFVPTGLMEKVSERLQSTPNASKRALRKLGKAMYVDMAIKQLVSLGYLGEQRTGVGKRTHYTLHKPFDGATIDQPCPRVPGVSQPCLENTAT